MSTNGNNDDDNGYNKKFEEFMSAIFSDTDEKDEELKTFISQFTSLDEAQIEYQYKDFSDTEYTLLQLTHRDFVKLAFFFFNHYNHDLFLMGPEDKKGRELYDKVFANVRNSLNKIYEGILVQKRRPSNVTIH